MNRKIFIDAGGNKGQSLKAFRRMREDSDSFVIHCFEPTKGSFERIENYIDSVKESVKINAHRKAVWIKDEELTFYVKNSFSEGNTLIKDKASSSWESLVVEGLDFSRWLFKNVSKDDYCILKMDIEGAEYEVIEHMNETGAIELVDELYLEVHGLKCNKSFEDSMSMLQTVTDNGLVPYIWCANDIKKDKPLEIYNEEKMRLFYESWQKRGFKLKQKGK